MSITLDKFHVNTIGFEQVKLPNNTTIILPRLNSKEMPRVRLPRIELTCYGVPRLGQYFKTDKDRQFIQLPITGETLAKFQLIDNLIQCNSALKEVCVGFEYSPIVKQGKQGPYIKLKLETDHETGDITTQLWISEKQADGNIETEPVSVDNMDEFASVFPLNCSVNCEIRFVSLWCINKRFGLTIKLTKANVLQPAKPVVDCSGIEFDF